MWISEANYDLGIAYSELSKEHKNALEALLRLRSISGRPVILHIGEASGKEEPGLRIKQ